MEPLPPFLSNVTVCLPSSFQTALNVRSAFTVVNTSPTSQSSVSVPTGVVTTSCQWLKVLP